MLKGKLIYKHPKFGDLSYEVLGRDSFNDLKLYISVEEVENGEICIYGHVHDKPVQLKSKSFCVCVERIGYRPKLLFEKN